MEGLCLRFGGLTVLDAVSLQVPAGSITALIGPNGAGKTSLFNAVSGCYRPQAGSITFAGSDVTRLPAARRAALGMARTFQNIALFGGMSVLDNIKVGGHVHLRAGLPAAGLYAGRARREERRLQSEIERDLAELVGIGDSLHQKQAVQSGVDAMFMGTFWAMEPLVIQQLEPLADRYMGVFPYRYYWEQEESATLRLIAQVTQADYVPTFALQAWFSGMILTEAIKRTLDAGKELTGDNLKEALDGIQDWDTGGLIGVPVSFRNNSIPVGRIYQGNSATGRMDPVSDWIVLDD